MIRPLLKQDVPQIVGLATVMAAETGHRLHADRTQYILNDIIELNTVFAQGRVEDDGRCTSMFIGETSEHPFFDALFAQELAIYTHPDRRGSLDAARLVKAFTAWATEKDVDYIKVEITAGVDNERAAQLFEKFGYSKGGILAFQGIRREVWPSQQ